MITGEEIMNGGGTVKGDQQVEVLNHYGDSGNYIGCV